MNIFSNRIRVVGSFEAWNAHAASGAQASGKAQEWVELVEFANSIVIWVLSHDRRHVVGQWWISRGDLMEKLKDADEQTQDRYLYGDIESGAKVAERLHAALEHLRSCELAGQAGADDQLVLDALYSYEAFARHG